MLSNHFIKFIQSCIPCCCFTTQVVVTAAANIALDVANLEQHTQAVDNAIDRVFTPMTVTAISSIDTLIQLQEEEAEVEMPRPNDHPTIRSTAELVESITNTTIHLARDAANAAVAIYLEQKKASSLSPIAQSVITRAAQVFENATDFVIHTSAEATIVITDYLSPTVTPHPPLIPRPCTPLYPIDESDTESFESARSNTIGNDTDMGIEACNII